jgi:DNA-binding SARP family transcriptional activator/TolB-like protein
MTDEMMIRLRVLGGVSLHRGDDRLTEVLSGAKRTALLVYLALSDPDRGIERDDVLARFWPESTDTRARQSFRQLLHVLRKELGSNVIQTEGTRVRLTRGSLSCDAVTFQAAADDGDHQRALELYAGELLPGFHVSGLPELEEWIDTERRALAEVAARSAWALVEATEEAGDAAGAAHWARRAVRLAPFHERGVRRLIELLDRSGDRAAALAAYDELSVRLERQWEVDPSPETQALIEGVRERREQISQPEKERPGRSVDEASGESRGESPTGTEDVRTVQPISAPAASAGVPVAPSLASDAAGDADEPTWSIPLAPLPVMIILLAVVGWVVMNGRDADLQSAATASDDGRTRVVVLRFDHVGDEDDAYLANGVTEEARLALSRSSGILVKGLGYELPERGGRGLGELGSLWDVDRILYGSVRTEGERVRVTAYLVDAATEEHLWSEAFDGSPDDMLGLQDRVARGVAEGLGAEVVARPEGSTPANSAAYQLWEQALWTFRSTQRAPSWDEQLAGLERAMSILRDVLELEPDFAPALANLGQAHLNVYARGLRSPEAFRPEWTTFEDSARWYVGRALTLAPHLPEVVNAAGAVGYRPYDRAIAQEVFAKWADHPALLDNVSQSTLRWHRQVLDSALIAEHLRRDVGLPTVRPGSYEASSLVLTRLGMHDDAIRWRRFALRLRRESEDHGSLAWQLAMSGSPDEAYAVADRWAESLTNEWRHRIRGDLALFQHDYAAASRLYRAAIEEVDANRSTTGIPSVDTEIERLPDHTYGRFLRSAYAMSLSRTGSRAEARPLLQEEIDRHLQGIEPDRNRWKVERYYDLALLHAELGDLDEAIAWFERAVDLGWSWYELAQIDPLFDPLRDDPRVQDLMAEVKADLDETAARARVWLDANADILPR